MKEIQTVEYEAGDGKRFANKQQCDDYETQRQVFQSLVESLLLAIWYSLVRNVSGCWADVLTAQKSSTGTKRARQWQKTTCSEGRKWTQTASGRMDQGIAGASCRTEIT